MYFIPFRIIFQSHSAGFHKKEDRKEGTERKASSPSAPPFLLPLRPVRISPCQLDSALARPHFPVPARFRSAPSRCGLSPYGRRKGGTGGKQALPPLLPFFFRTAQCYSIKLVGSTGSPSLSISKYRLGPSTL